MMANMVKKLLLIDDDDMLRATLKEQLEAQGEFEVTACKRAEAGLRCAQERCVDMALLGAVLPDMDSGAMCHRLRENGLGAPILMLTGGGANVGIDDADDHIAKPFRFHVLLARIRANLRQHEQSEKAGLQVGPYHFFPGAKLLLGADDNRIRLTEKETAILQYLLRARGRLVSKSELLQEVWGYGKEVTTATLETHVYRLRRKIQAAANENADEQSLLRTGAGGYRLTVQD